MQIPTQPWSIPIKDLTDALNTPSSGLTDQEVDLRLAKYGSNTFHTKEKPKVLGLFLKQFVSPLIFLLVGAAVLASVLHEWTNTAVIAFAVLLNVFLGFYHEFHAENTLDKLTTYIKDRTRVIRSGRESEIDSSMLVPGDIVKLSYGSRIPADARIISLNDLRVDESILTGESIPIDKKEDLISMKAEITERSNIAHAGTLVVQGYATALVYATGNTTEIGKIAGIVSKIDRSKTPLQKGVNHLAWMIFVVVMIIVVGILVLGILRGESIIPMLILSAAVAVGAVPEGLPIVFTVILAIGAEHIAKKKGIVKKLAAAETLGSTTLIMTDKTGTLTVADMRLVGIHSTSVLLSPDFNHPDQKDFSQDQKRLLELSLSNVDVSIENPKDPEAKWHFRGRPFEVNIVKACRLHGLSLESIAATYSSVVMPFNSTNKFSVAEKNDMYIVMGAPDILLKKSNISKEEYLKLQNSVETISSEGKRLIGIATLPKKHNKKNISLEDVENLEFLGMFVFFDPIRPEAPMAIKNIESYGIKMVIISGDLPGTALSVAKSLDWEVKPDEVLTGSELHGFSDVELRSMIPKIKIFARVTPEDKLRIGKLYQDLGEIVAMTGDGVNDSPALKAMDIGISLGSSSDVAKSASDMVLLDDNLQTISLAIDEGRRILSNIRKSFVYLMSNSLDDVFVIGGSLLFALPLPLNALQIIWVNLFTGSLPALAFAYEEDRGKEKYSGKELKLIFTKEVKWLTFFVGIISSLLLFILYYLLIKNGIEEHIARSVFFVCFSSYVLAIAFSFRSLHRPLFSFPTFSNKKLNYSIIISLVLLIATMTLPFMRNIFDIAPMPLSWLPFIVFWLILNILLVEGTKYIIRKKDYFFTKFKDLKNFFSGCK
jgi:Ca2+-transporting ATPase